MACEARIVRVLRTLEYPGALDMDVVSAPSLLREPAEIARIVAWIEDTKVRGRPIADRAPLLTSGPGWTEAFFSYLRDIECPRDFSVAAPGGGDGEEDVASSVLRGVSWLVNKAIACEFEDHGDDYNKAARQLLAQPRQPGALPRGDCDFSQAAATHAQNNDRAVGAQRVEHEDGAHTPWSPAFLSALDATCRSLGVEPPSSSAAVLPRPQRVIMPPEEESVNPPRPPDGDDADERGLDACVLEALEASLAEVRKRIALRDTTLVVNDDGGRGEVRAVGPGGGVCDELEGFPVGICTGDEACDRVATVLRMLFLLDLRGLQDEVNAVLALAQASKP